MPQPIIYKDQWGQAASALGQALGGFGGKQYKDYQERQSLSALEQALQDPSISPEQRQMAYAKAIQQMGTEKAKPILEMYDRNRKESAWASAFDEYEKSNQWEDLKTPEGKAKFMSLFASKGGDPLQAFKLFDEKKGGESAFDREIGKRKAKIIGNFLESGLESDSFNENLEFLEDNIEKVGRQNAFLGAEIPGFQSGIFTEYANRGNLVLDGVIKIFNRNGQVAQKKLKWIRDTFSISPYDTQAQIQGKINALKSLAKDTQEFEERMGESIEKNGTNIPDKELFQATQNLNKKFNEFEKKYNYKDTKPATTPKSPQKEPELKENQYFSKTLPKEAEEDTTAISQTGETYIFQKGKWKKQ